jgi:hypothetical protein
MRAMELGPDLKPGRSLFRRRGDRLTVRIMRRAWLAGSVRGGFLLVTITVLGMLRINRVVTCKFLLEPSADGLKRLGGFANNRVAELDDRSTISISLLNSRFSGVDVIIIG